MGKFFYVRHQRPVHTVGKSSLFNILTEQAIAAENYPFCTIDPNEGR